MLAAVDASVERTSVGSDTKKDHKDVDAIRAVGIKREWKEDTEGWLLMHNVVTVKILTIASYQNSTRRTWPYVLDYC